MQSSTFSIILSRKLDSFSSTIFDIFKRFISYAGDGQVDLVDFVQKYSFKNDNYERFIYNYSLLASQNPKISTPAFLNYLMNFQKKLTALCKNDPKISKNNVFIENVVYYFTYTILSEIITNILKKLTEDNKKVEIEVISFIFADSIMFYMTDQFEIDFLIEKEIAKKKTKVFYYLSLLDCDLMLEMINDKMKYIMEENKKTLLYYACSSIVVPKEIKNDLIDLVEMTANEFNQSSGELHEASGFFFANILAQIITNFDELATSSQFANYYQKITVLNEPKSSITTSIIFSLMTNFINSENNLKHADVFFDEIIKEKTDENNFSIMCTMMTVKLFGKNFQQLVLNYLKCCNFNNSATFKDIKSFYQNISKWLQQSLKNVKEDNYLSVASLLEQLCTTDSKLFFSEIVVGLLDSINIDHIKTPLAIALKNVAEKNDTPELKQELSKCILELMKRNKISISSNKQRPFTANNLTITINSLINDKGDKLREIYRNLDKTSYPIFGHEKDKMKSEEGSKSLRTLASMIENTFRDTVNQETAEEFNNNNLSRNIFEEQILLACLYVEPSKELLDCICTFIFSERAFTGALAIRCLEGIIHKYSTSCEAIIIRLCYIINNRILSFSSIIFAINTLILILETANIEGIIISSEAISCISSVLTVGLCLPYPEIRKRILHVCRAINDSKINDFFLLKFLDKYEDKISERASINATLATSYKDNIEDEKTPQAKFTEVVGTNYSSLYSFYLSAFGHYFSEEFGNSEYQATVIITQKLITSILENLKSKEVESIFVNNCAILLFSISDAIDYNNDNYKYFIMQKIKEVCKDFTQAYEKKKVNTFFLTSLFSSASFELFETIIPLLCSPQPFKQNILTFGLLNSLRKKPSCIFNENNELRNTIYVALHSSLITCYRAGIVSDKLTYSANLDVKYFGSKEVTIFLRSFGHLLRIVFDACYNTENKQFENEKWLIFFLNITFIQNDIIRGIMLSAFSSWLKISRIKKEHFKFIFDKILDYTSQSSTVAMNIFTRDPENLIDIYIENAISEFPIFRGLSCQIETPKNVIANIEQISEIAQKMKESKLNIISILYSRCGCLLSLCFEYLTSEIASEREEAVNFIEKLSLVSMCIRSDLEDAVSVYTAINSIRNMAKTSFDELIRKGIYNLADSVNKLFAFCSEQFIDECCKIIAIKKSKRLELKETKPKEEIRSERLTLIEYRSNSMLKQSQPIVLDQFDVDQAEVLMNITSLWLTKFKCNQKCEGEFCCFGIQKLLEKLIKLCEKLGMVPSIAQILDLIIDKDPQFFIYCLFKLRSKCNDDFTSIRTFLLYLFNKIPEKFVEYLSTYFDISYFCFNHVYNITGNEETMIFYDSFVPYLNDISFATSIVKDCYKDNPNAMRGLLTKVIQLCTFMYPDDTDTQMKEFLAMFGLQNGVITKSDIQKNEFCHCNDSKFILDWGLCCGKLSYATNALKLYNNYGFVIQKEYIGLILRSMQVVCNVLNERTDPKKSSQFNKFISIRMFTGNTINLDSAIEYLDICMTCLNNYVSKPGNDFPLELFKGIIGFLNLKSKSYSRLFSCAVSLIKKFVSSPKNLEKLNSNPDICKDGIINMFFNFSDANESLIEDMSCIILTLVEKKMFHVLSPDQNTPIVSLYILVPFMWGCLNSISTCRDISDYFANKYKEPSMRQIIMNAISGQSRNPANIINLNKRFINEIPPETINNILNLYSEIVIYGTQDQVEAVLYFTGDIVQSLSDVKGNKNISCIVDAVTKVKNSKIGKMSESVYNFLRIMFDTDVETFQSQKLFKISLFPRINVYDNQKILEWRAMSKDVFDDPLHYPPLIITDSVFIGAEFRQKQMESIDYIKDIKFNKLKEEFSASEEQNNQNLKTAKHQSDLEMQTMLNGLSLLMKEINV